MDGPWTRLVHIQSGRIERFSINHETPPYLAVSYAWSDRLFPPGVPFSETAGAQAIYCLKTAQTEDEKEEQKGEYGDVAYCWIDTLCIDQDDAEDKQRQIPLMGSIYGNAQLVAIVTNEHIGLSQKQVDVMAESVRGAVEMSINGSWLVDGKRWTHNEKNRLRLRQAMDCLEIFTRPAWGSRVWTMQEFILARRTVWIGGDLRPVRVAERLFQAIPDVCDSLSVAECLVPKYEKLYHHFAGMAGARLRLIDQTRVMELLGNKTATVPEDEVYGLMAASGVVLQQTNVKGKEKVWEMWWEEAVRRGHIRWALLPPASRPAVEDDSRGLNMPISRNCIMPAYAVRHLASSNSYLDSPQPYGRVEVQAGTVSMVGRLAGRCHIVRKLGRLLIDPDGAVVRDITLVQFASNSWPLALCIACAFGAGRYSLRQRAMIAQVLVFNYYRARLAVLEQRTKSFRPRFRTLRQATIWSDFMLLQNSHARVMNDGVAFLARISNDVKFTDVIVVTDGERPPGSSLWAVDFGAINDSEKTMFTIVKAAQGGAAAILSSVAGEGEPSATSPSLHRVGVSMYMQVTDDIGEASSYASHILEQPQIFQRFDIGGARCAACRALSNKAESATGEDTSLDKHDVVKLESTSDSALKFRMRLDMRKQNLALRTRWKKSLRQEFAR